ncbi:MAG: FG-nucleoporin nsp1 [Chaenotheca gracillima]|nr:MAG: FG-nucleoporin nsp1 [Chaenotheca gracillima]
MARGGRSRGKSRGGRGTPRGGRNQVSFVPASNSSPHTNGFKPTNENERHSYSLRDEAKNTGSRRDGWSSEIKLRNSKVNFVSAGHLHGKDLEGSDEADEDDYGDVEGLGTPGVVSDTAVNEPGDVSSGPDQAFAEMNIDDEDDKPKSKPVVMETSTMQTRAAEPEKMRADQPAEDHFVIDVEGSRAPVNTGLPPPVIRASSPTPSNSSDEVILFTGRNRNGDSVANTRATSPSKSPIVPDLSPVYVPNPEPLPTSYTQRDDLFVPPEKVRRDRQRRSPAGRAEASTSKDDDMLADYIENLREAGELDDLINNNAFSSRELGGPETLHDSGIARNSSSRKPSKTERLAEDGWASSDVHDLDDLSTSEGIFDAVEQILSKRERPHGLQYLIVWQGHTVDDARWIPHSSLTMDGAEDLIRAFEENEKLLPEYAGLDESTDSDSDSDDDDDLGEDTDEEEEDWKDQEDLQMRKIERMTDEKIAQLLAKQEELGMGSEEIILFDDDDGDDDAIIDEDFAEIRSTRKPSRRTGRSKRAKGEIPSASVVADAYDDFDVMDWERPSVQKKPKGRKADLPFELSDSELEATLRSTWTRDRDKKKAKKQEREELRSEGLLGKSKKGKPDLKAKYKEGMDIEDIKDEIRDFLISDRQSLPLPPMNKTDRKLVHEIANAFGLKSKSVGDSIARFPTLYKTKKSTIYDADALGVIESRLNSRRFLPRMDKKSKGSGPALAIRRRAGGRATNNAAVTYRDGEVVGAAAPELGVENRGRAMLEKMGWSSGSALGALNNKGILQPVSHVVKVSKAGLG